MDINRKMFLFSHDFDICSPEIVFYHLYLCKQEIYVFPQGMRHLKTSVALNSEEKKSCFPVKRSSVWNT